MKLTYPVCLYRDEETGAYAVEVPDLPGCSTGGDTLADAILMGIDAASGWVLTELEEGRPAPPPARLARFNPNRAASSACWRWTRTHTPKNTGTKP